MLQVRRQREAERLKRIKDPSTRGKIDTDALAAQIAEKQAAAAAEHERELIHDKERMLLEQQINYLEQERLRCEREKGRDLLNFRATMQTKPQGREYDLNDPNALRTDEPARMGDDDPRLSVSGLQKFHGEDLSYGHRVKMQQAQLREWNEQLAAEKAAAKVAEAQEERAYAQSMMQLDALKGQMESKAVASRQNAAAATAEYQRAQAAAKRERERALQVAELQDSVEEIQANLQGTTLTEDPTVGQSFINPDRVRPDHYKGMSPEEQQAIKLQQEAQRQQKQVAAEQAKAEAAAEDAQAEQLRRMGDYQELMVARKRAELRKQMTLENQQLAQEQLASKTYLDTKVFTNAIHPSFFNQFNTSSR